MFPRCCSKRQTEHELRLWCFDSTNIKRPVWIVGRRETDDLHDKRTHGRTHADVRTTAIAWQHRARVTDFQRLYVWLQSDIRQGSQAESSEKAVLWTSSNRPANSSIPTAKNNKYCWIGHTSRYVRFYRYWNLSTDFENLQLKRVSNWHTYTACIIIIYYN